MGVRGSFPPARPLPGPGTSGVRSAEPPRCPGPPRWAERQDDCLDRAQTAALSWSTPTPHRGLPRKARPPPSVPTATSLQRYAHRLDRLSTERPAHRRPGREVGQCPSVRHERRSPKSLAAAVLRTRQGPPLPLLRGRGGVITEGQSGRWEAEGEEDAAEATSPPCPLGTPTLNRLS